jgi:hypothetical protein
MYRNGEEDWTKHDTVAALVTHSKPALWKFHWPESVHCTVHCNRKRPVCVQTNPAINLLLLLHICTLHLGIPSSSFIEIYLKHFWTPNIKSPPCVVAVT